MDKQIKAAYLLAAARNFTAEHFNLIAGELGGIDQLLDAGTDAISRLDLPGSKLERLKEVRQGADPDAELARLAGSGISVVAYGTPEYPELLAQIHDAPVLLFCKGDPSIMRHHGVAIVGSRKCSSVGRELASAIGRDLAELGIPVVSGMALGIDAAAHEGALQAGGLTVAVLGCGVDVIYPPAHHELYEQLCTEALVVSEYPPGTPPDKGNFPRRNRIISGLARGVLVVEGPLSSGSLITARSAIEQGREVFALPGPLRSPYSKGPHHLIKQGQAKLVEGVDDILVEFNTSRAELMKQHGGKAAAAGEGATAQAPGLFANAQAVEPSADERRLLEHISYEGTHINDLVRELGLTTGDCISHLTMLEIKGLISTAGGGYYIRQ